MGPNSRRNASERQSLGLVESVIIFVPVLDIGRVLYIKTPVKWSMEKNMEAPRRSDGAFGEGCLYQVLSLVLFFFAIITLGVPVLSVILGSMSVWMFVRGYRRARM